MCISSIICFIICWELASCTLGASELPKTTFAHFIFWNQFSLHFGLFPRSLPPLDNIHSFRAGKKEFEACFGEIHVLLPYYKSKDAIQRLIVEITSWICLFLMLLLATSLREVYHDNAHVAWLTQYLAYRLSRNVMTDIHFFALCSLTIVVFSFLQFRLWYAILKSTIEIFDSNHSIKLSISIHLSIFLQTLVQFG